MSDELDLSLIARCDDFEIDGGEGAQRQGIDFQGGSLNGILISVLPTQADP